MLKLFLKNTRGFTLVELMVVVVILGVLTSIAIPVYNNTQENAKEKACWANQRMMEGAYQQYLANEGNAVTDDVKGEEIFTNYLNGYLRAMPTCPGSKEKGVGQYTLTPDGKVTCSSHSYYGDNNKTTTTTGRGT